MTRPIHAVIVAYHAADQLDHCLATLGTHVKTTVIDNSSSPTVRIVSDRRGATYVDPGQNLGFGAGVNVALRPLLAGPPSDVLLLNPDATLDPRELDKLSQHLRRERNQRLAAVSPRLVGPEGVEHQVVWPFPSPLRCWAEAIGLGRFPARHTIVIGALVLLRWEALREVGLFDERFFLYAEEADWQRRALASGWTSGLCPDAVGFHAGAGTTTDPMKREELFHAAHETYMRKWYGRKGWWVYRCGACIGATARAVLLAGDRRSEAARRARLYARGPRRCAGLTQN